MTKGSLSLCTTVSAISAMLSFAAFHPAQAADRCGAPYSGPRSDAPEYIFLSSCTTTQNRHVVIGNQICSVTAQNLPFFWERLNWVSGSQGVTLGECMYNSEESNLSDVIDEPGSTIHLYGALNRTETTNVYLSGNSGSAGIVAKTIERRPGKRGGDVRPFRLHIAYKRLGENSVSISLRVQAGDPVVYLYLPQQVRSLDDLSGYIEPKYLDQIRQYISFNDKDDRVQAFSNDDPAIATYKKQKELSGRARVSLQTSGSEVNFELEVRSTLPDALSAFTVCVGEFKSVISCL